MIRIAPLAAALAAVLLLGTGCPMWARPNAAPKPACGSASPTTCPEPRPNGNCEDCLDAQPRLDKAPRATCIVGEVKTAGDMVFVVQRAGVAVRSDGKVLGTTFTDEAGHFVWCAPTGRIVSGTEVTITVSKPPLEPSEAMIEWRTGHHAVLTFAMEAEGLTH